MHGARLRALIALAALAVAPVADAFDWHIDVTPAGELFPALLLFFHVLQKQ